MCTSPRKKQKKKREIESNLFILCRTRDIAGVTFFSCPITERVQTNRSWWLIASICFVTILIQTRINPHFLFSFGSTASQPATKAWLLLLCLLAWARFVSLLSTPKKRRPPQQLRSDEITITVTIFSCSLFEMYRIFWRAESESEYERTYKNIPWSK